MEVFFIVLAVIAAAGVVFFLFVMEPRRKISTIMIPSTLGRSRAAG